MSFEWPIEKFLVQRLPPLSSQHALRDRMIADTQRYLSAELCKHWVVDRQSSGTSSRRGRLQLRPVDAVVDRVSWCSTRHATDITILQLCADGDLDRARLRRLLRPLDRMVVEQCRGDVVLDFADTNPVSLRVVDVVALLQQRVQQRCRQLLVCGLPNTPQFTRRAELTGIRAYRTQREAVEQVMFPGGRRKLM